MGSRAVARRAGIELAGLALGQRDQLLERFDRQVRIGRQNQGILARQNDRLEVAQRLVAERRIEREVRGQRRVGGEQKRVAVRRRLGDHLGADAAAGAGTVDDHHRLAPRLAQAVAELARQNVDGAARRVRHHDLNGALGIFGVRRCRGRQQTRGEYDTQTAHHRSLYAFDYSRSTTATLPSSMASARWPCLSASALSPNSSRRQPFSAGTSARSLAAMRSRSSTVAITLAATWWRSEIIRNSTLSSSTTAAPFAAGCERCCSGSIFGSRSSPRATAATIASPQ